MNIEKEERYEINDEFITKVKELTEPYKEKVASLDITFGLKGFESLSEYGYICRVRQKGEKILLENKKMVKEINGWLEQEIEIKSIREGAEFYTIMGLKPYLYLKRDREVRKYKNLEIYIDEFEVLGNYMEIEYQNSDVNELEEFKRILGIEGFTPQPLYGDIVKTKLISDFEFKQIYEDKLEELLKGI